MNITSRTCSFTFVQITVVLFFTITFLCNTIEVNAYSSSCPANCESSKVWCEQVFGRGGFVNSTECTNSSFLCTCNNDEGILITREEPTDNDGDSSINVNANAPQQCTWDGLFDAQLPFGNYCYPATSICPTSCASFSTSLCDTSTFQCNTNSISSSQLGQGETIINYTCAMCSGSVFTFLGKNNTTCTKTITPLSPEICTPQRTCNGHGCCNPGTATVNRVDNPCVCFNDDINGYWSGAECQECASGYTPNSNGVCNVPKPRIEVILSSIAKTWTMVLPNMIIIFLFVVCGMARPSWQSDVTFESTSLRRANLSAIQERRRRRQALLHSKYIPNRPAQSQSFANTRKDSSLDPFAY